MRDRLIELLMDSEAFNGADGKADAKHIADYLLENGVIVLPRRGGGVDEITLTQDNAVELPAIEFNYELTPAEKAFVNLMKRLETPTKLLTREEAERALKGGEG